MSNVSVTSSIVAKEGLAILENMLGFSKNVNRDWEDEYSQNMSRGYEPGNTINIKKPPRYTYRAGRVAVPQATTQTTVPLTLSQGGADLFFTSNERTTSYSRLEDKLQAAMATVANEIDRQGLELARNSVYNALNPTYAAPNTAALAVGAVTAVNQRMDEMSAPRDMRRALTLSPALNANLITGLAGLFNASSTLDKQYGKGIMVDSLGLRYHMDQNIATHTNGAATATNINGANQTGSSVTVIAVAAGTLTKNTIITLPGVFAVNPQSRQSTGVLAQFIVTADVAAGATSIPISPAIVTTGAFQNVTASPTTAQPYVIFGAASTSYTCSTGYHKDAFTLAMVPMWVPPSGMGAKVSQAEHNGFRIKVTDYYDGVNDTANMRVDVLFGWAAPYPELACKYAI
mgnify:CR=1 FL=1